MQALDKNLNLKDFKKIDLAKEFREALKDPNFKLLATKTKMKEEELKNYTSILQDCAAEYGNCMKCAALAECGNRIMGHVYLPTVKEKQLAFIYKNCKYYEKHIKETKHLDNVRYFNVPNKLLDASISKIFKDDKKRFAAIKKMVGIRDTYEDGKNTKGLYLYGNFGCGKTYFIAALFNDLAKKGFKSSIVFWPDFVRSGFDNDFKEKYEYVRNVPLLLIDDIGAENLTAWNRDEILCPLLQYRMDEGLTTFFTSNFSLVELTEHLANSKSGVEGIKAGRIISRIEQLTSSMEMISENLRK